MRALLQLHRYLGIAVGLLMVSWCLSGFVLMYQGYPSLAPQVRQQHLQSIAWRDCCTISARLVGDADPIAPFRIEMLAGRPVLNWVEDDASAGLIDLLTGAGRADVSPTEAAAVAAGYSAKTAKRAAPHLIDLINSDQWTLEGVAPEDRPLYHFDLRDGLGGQLYVSSWTGQALQLTTRRERFWGWLGAVPHWLYFTALRTHEGLWTQLVIYTALIGCFLAGVGLFIGVRQLWLAPTGRWSPYRGFNRWHHLAGLFFGIFALTWVLSGLLSMNPWGLLEGAGPGSERARLNGAPITGVQLRAALRVVATVAPDSVVAIQSAPLADRLFLIATHADGSRQRWDAQGRPAPLSFAERQFIARVLGADGHGIEALTAGDAYYFSAPGQTIELPVWRVRSNDGNGRRYYLDPISGALLAVIDRSDQRYRWWFSALHRMDFTAAIRGRPQWDLLMWLLLSGVTLVCVTGAYMGYRRLLRG